MVLCSNDYIIDYWLPVYFHPKFRKNNVELLYAMLIYLLTTGISLSCFDLARIDVIPFLLFLLQTWKWDRDELEELEYDV